MSGIMEAVGSLEMASAAILSGNKEDAGPLIQEALRTLRTIRKIHQGEADE